MVSGVTAEFMVGILIGLVIGVSVYAGKPGLEISQPVSKIDRLATS
jgi:hypothetical protein